MSASFHPTTKTWIHLHDYGTNAPPILALDDSAYGVTISVFKDVPAGEHRSVARELLAAVTAYAAAAETWADARVDALLHTPSDDTGKAA